MEFAAELQASLEEFTASGVVEVRENGGSVAPFSGMSWEVRGDGEKPLLHLWSEQFNLTRRVLAITDHSEQRLALAVERFGRAKPDRLEFIRREFERGARELSREEFRDRLTHLLAEQFPDEKLQSLVVSPDLEHSLSGNYARGILRRGSADIAVLAVPGDESSEVTDNSLTFALLWLQQARRLSARRTIIGVRLILPKTPAVRSHTGSLHSIRNSLSSFTSTTPHWKLSKKSTRDARETWTPGHLARPSSRERGSSQSRAPIAESHFLTGPASRDSASRGTVPGSVAAFSRCPFRPLG